MRKEPTDQERFFPQVILARAIARIRATLEWADGVEMAIAQRMRDTPNVPSRAKRTRNA